MSEVPCCADESEPGCSLGDQSALKALRMVLKLLLEEAPQHVMVMLTGSSMAAAWLNTATMATAWLNTATMQAGYTLLVNSPGLDWPTGHSQGDMEKAWQALRTRHPELPQDLLRWSEPTPATLNKLALDWLECGCPQNLQAFAADFTRAEFVEAVRALPLIRALFPGHAAQLLFCGGL